MSAVATTPEVSPSSDAPWQPKVNPWWIALAVMLATFMEVLDTSVASVSLPYIAGNLGSSNDEATWVLTSYLVANAVVLPTSAWFGNFFGRKRFLMGCIILFTASSFVCGAATNLGMLIVARIFQGAGGGALQPLAQSILLESFPPARRGVAMAVYGVGVVVAPILGPTLGGWITDSYSWRWCFFINLPVGILAVFLISLFVEDPPYIRAAKPKSFDAIGFSLLAIWLATFQVVLDKGQDDDWFGALWLRWFAVVSVVSFVCLVIRELRAPSPVVNLRVLKDRNLSVGCVLFLLFGAVLYAMTTMMPLFLQTLLGYTALDAGLTVSPRGLGALVAFGLVGAISQKVNPRVLLGFGFVMQAASCVMLSRLDLQVSMGGVVPANLLMGFSMGFIFVPLTTMTLGGLSREQIGAGTGLQNLMRNLGGAMGISYVTTMLVRFAQAHQGFMAAHLSSLNPSYQKQLGTLQKAFAPSFSPVDALHRAQGSIYNIVLLQANYWAYMNIFYVMIWVSAVCVLGAIMFKKVKTAGPVVMH